LGWTLGKGGRFGMHIRERLRYNAHQHGQCSVYASLAQGLCL
jgi:hypothetical protein